MRLRHAFLVPKSPAVILCDTSVIVAVINRRDQDHAVCAQLLRTIRFQLITTWPCITEDMYRLQAHAGPVEQETLRRQIERGFFALVIPALADALRVCAPIRQYADTPMDFADASLVLAAEVLSIRRVLTLDRHFYAYRIHGGTPFEVIPPLR